MAASLRRGLVAEPGRALSVRRPAAAAVDGQAARRHAGGTSWASTAASLEVISRLGRHELGGHVLALAGRLRDELGLPPRDTAIVMLADPALQARLAEAGITASATPKGTRLAFHAYNDDRDVDAVLEILHGAR